MNADGHVLDAYVIDTLMGDLVGHDRRPSAFIVYLGLVAAAGNDGGSASLSHAELAERTGLSKRSVQDAIGWLKRRGLLDVKTRGPTEIQLLTPLKPWARSAEA